MENAQAPLVNNFEVPSWAGKPLPGLHLDVKKDGKMVQKLMLDEKKCYFFGRNKQMCDFTIDHASCSRVHSALIWHKHLSRPFLIDLGSTHGTFIGNIRLEKRKPQQVPIDSEIHFGASTRMYVIRERPQPVGPQQANDDKHREELEGGLLGLPETETELDNLTEFNTAHNRRISSIPGRHQPDLQVSKKRKYKYLHVGFHDENEVINPEDIDPSIGRFRNMIQTTIIAKKKKFDVSAAHGINMTESITKRLQSFSYATSNLYGDLPSTTIGGHAGSSLSIASKLGLPVPNLAPSLEEEPVQLAVIPVAPVVFNVDETPKEPKKKKYAKEAWPGRRPTHSLLV